MKLIHIPLLLLLSLALTGVASGPGPTDGECCGGTTTRPAQREQNGDCEVKIFPIPHCAGTCIGVTLEMGEDCEPVDTINAGTQCWLSTKEQRRTTHPGDCGPVNDCICIANFGIVTSSGTIPNSKLQTATCL